MPKNELGPQTTVSFKSGKGVRRIPLLNGAPVTDTPVDPDKLVQEIRGIQSLGVPFKGRK